MKVYHDPECLRHNPPHEILSDHLVPYLESPNRLELVKNTLSQNRSFMILSPEQEWSHNLLSYILAVHTQEYVDHLKTIYDDWVLDRRIARSLIRRRCNCGSPLPQPAQDPVFS
ncbi:hypothetical protein C8Q73DRAFT_302440 [Cubamyces lactineus]|nr:hypothetical protein C8Q73DRAFT_302440 [Cubamyces lactineus]